MSNRLNFIDVARAYAIGLALFAHSISTLSGWSFEGAGFVLAITRTATPLFIFIFGMMLEVVYVRRVQRGGIRPSSQRLLMRAGQCYVGYALTVCAGIMGGYLTAREGALALVFLESAHFSNILRLYAVALALAPALLLLRLRYGRRLLVGLLVTVWILDFALLDHYDGVALGSLTPWFGILLGTGSFLGGPSVFHGLTFVLAGQLVASGLTDWREKGLGRFYRYGSIVLVAAITVAGCLAFSQGVLGVLRGFIQYSVFRAHNHIGYYAVGLIACLVTTFVLSVIIPKATLPAWSGIPLKFGQASLFSFSLGNVLLNLIPEAVVGSGLGLASLPISLCFVAVMLLLVNWRPALGIVRLKLAGTAVYLRAR